MEISYLKARGVVILLMIWSAILGGIGYLRQNHLTWSEIVTETETTITSEGGLLILLWAVGLIIFICLYDWDSV